MTAGQWTEQQEAGASGPRALNEPGSPVWCWQTISHLQTLWKSVNIDLRLYEQTWAEAEEHRVWEKVPYQQPYGSKEYMLSALEAGDVPAARARAALKALTAVPLGQHGGTDGHNKKEGAESHLPPGKRGKGTVDYLTARIARDAPEVWERMKRGEFKSAAEAARAAGIRLAKRKKSVTLSDNVDRVAEKLKGHYSQEQIRQLREHLRDAGG